MWKDSTKADKAAELMQMVPQALLKQGIIEGIIPESEKHQQTCKNIEQILLKRLNKLQKLSPNQLLANRKNVIESFKEDNMGNILTGIAFSILIGKSISAAS